MMNYQLLAILGPNAASLHLAWVQLLNAVCGKNDRQKIIIKQNNKFK